MEKEDKNKKKKKNKERTQYLAGHGHANYSRRKNGRRSAYKMCVILAEYKKMR